MVTRTTTACIWASFQTVAEATTLRPARGPVEPSGTVAEGRKTAGEMATLGGRCPGPRTLSACKRAWKHGGGKMVPRRVQPGELSGRCNRAEPAARRSSGRFVSAIADDKAHVRSERDDQPFPWAFEGFGTVYLRVIQLRDVESRIADK